VASDDVIAMHRGKAFAALVAGMLVGSQATSWALAKVRRAKEPKR